MADLLPRNRVLPNTTSQRGNTSQVLPSICVRLRQWMTVDDSLFLGTWTDKQSSIPYHDVVMQDLTSLVFSVCGVTCRRFGCGDGIREEGLRDDYLS
ncbi:hypothetical protein TNCV_2713291 [Trichonephila clavipes]|nr:hypothetical protein TNCV_2713291 [Trichonephila clavipes]